VGFLEGGGEGRERGGGGGWGGGRGGGGGGGGGGVRLSRMSYLLNGNSKRGSIGHVDIVWLPYLRHPVVFDSETSRLADRMGD